MNECITSNKTPPQLHKCQHLFGSQLARAAPVLLEAGGKPPVWFPPEALAQILDQIKFFIFFHKHLKMKIIKLRNIVFSRY